MLAYLDMPALGQPEAFLNANTVLTEAGEISQGSRQFVQTWMDRYVAWVEKHAAEIYGPSEDRRAPAGVRPS